jgi:uncharacterized membrane protein YebE (DUF533 family)
MNESALSAMPEAGPSMETIGPRSSGRGDSVVGEARHRECRGQRTIRDHRRHSEQPSASGNHHWQENTMFDPTRLLTQMLGGTLGGALGGKGGRKHHGSGLGGMMGGSVNKAALGVGALGIAMAAWEHYKGQSGAAQSTPTSPQPALAGSLPPPPPPASLPPPAPTVQLNQPVPEALLAIRSMIAAAAADGLIDGNEREAILGRASAAGMDADDQAALRAELAQPLSLPELIAQTPARFAAEVYVAALITISVDSDAERRWMDRLAQGLNLTVDQRSALDAQFSPSLPL